MPAPQPPAARVPPKHSLRRPLPAPDTGRKVLVVGMGPAGFTLAHHLMNDGHGVVAIDGLILLMAIFVFTIGGFKLAVSASREFSALLGIPRSLVYAIAPISGVFIVIAQIINIYEDITGEKVDYKEGADK